MRNQVEVVIVGAGPYGLSVAAHLRHAGMSLRIFGPPMQTWSTQMPKGMLLKSDGFASSLSDPLNEFPIEKYCAERSIPYHHLKVPVELDTFVNYGLEFQKRYVPDLDTRTVTHIIRNASSFLVTLEDGEQVSARRVIVAAGITHFSYIPEDLAHLSSRLVSHSSQHGEPSAQRGRNVTVLGAGASAVDLAVLLHEAGANVTMVARRKSIRFLAPPPPNGRSLWQRVRNPSSGLGPGIKSRFYCDAPGIFRRFPAETRLRLVDTSLGPAPGYPMRERLVGKVHTELGISNLRAEEHQGGVRLTYLDPDGVEKQHLTDHVIAATGYKVRMDRLQFIDETIRREIATIREAPVLSKHFESSVPGLYFIGIAAAYSFGPLMRFAYGAEFAANRIGKFLPATARKNVVRDLVTQPG